jgi:hypothetical protein
MLFQNKSHFVLASHREITCFTNHWTRFDTEMTSGIIKTLWTGCLERERRKSVVGGNGAFAA